MSIQQKFEQFHDSNPQVYRTLTRLAGAWLSRNRSVGIGMLWEVLRWSIGIETIGDEFRLNNSYRSRYARLLLEEHPEWVGRIRTRELRAA